jgi:hypothetical protein
MDLPGDPRQTAISDSPKVILCLVTERFEQSYLVGRAKQHNHRVIAALQRKNYDSIDKLPNWILLMNRMESLYSLFILKNLTFSGLCSHHSPCHIVKHVERKTNKYLIHIKYPDIWNIFASLSPIFKVWHEREKKTQWSVTK